MPVVTVHAWRSAVRVRGDDRGEYLHRMLTARVVGRLPGERVHTLLLDPRGHVLADLDAWFLESETRLLGDAAAMSAVLETLRRYLLRSRVEIDALSGSTTLLRLQGDEESLTGLIPAATAVGRMTLGGVDVWAAHRARWPGVDVLVASDATERVVAHLQAGRGFVRGDQADWERQRIELGIPLTGAELTGVELPQEAGLDGALDYDKGCFPGQETVARIHYRGHVNRLLRVVAGTARLAPGDTLEHQGRAVGRVTSAVTDDVSTLALAYLRTPAADVGSKLCAPDGSIVTVTAPVVPRVPRSPRR